VVVGFADSAGECSVKALAGFLDAAGFEDDSFFSFFSLGSLVSFFFSFGSFVSFFFFSEVVEGLALFFFSIIFRFLFRGC